MLRMLPAVRWWFLGALVWALAPLGNAHAQEVAPFRVMSTSAFAEVRARQETERSRPSGSTPSATRREQALEEEFGLATRSYLYHPNLAKLDLAGGLTLVQERTSGAGEEEAGSGAFTRLLARLSLLEDNSFPSTLYYSRTTPVVSLAVAERYRVTHTRYGGSVAVRAVAPVVAEAEAYRETTEGSGARQVTDETIDHLGLALHAPLHRAADFHGSLRVEQRRSASGTTDLAITETERTVRVAELSSSHVLGETGDLKLQNRLVTQWESASPRRRDLRFTPSGQWKITQDLRAYGRYSWRDSETNDTATTNRVLRLGLRHQLYESLFTRLEGRTEDSRTTGYSAEEQGLVGDLAYRKRLPLGRLEVTYRGDYAVGEQHSSARLVQVVGESLALPEFDPVALAQPGVEPGSVRVFNAARAQEFVEGTDYRAFTVGETTSLQRLAGSRIAPGEALVVDYAYAPAGTFGYAALDQTVGGSWSYQNLVTVYSRYRVNQRQRRSGTPLRPLNEAEVLTYGARLRVPFGALAWGLEAEAEHHEEDLAPFLRQTYQTYLEGAGTRALTWRLGVRRLLVDYRDSPEDTELWGVLGRLHARPAPRLLLGAEAGWEEDTGPTLARQAWFAKLRGEWGLAALRLGAEAGIRAEEQGEAERQITNASLFLRRDF